MDNAPEQVAYRLMCDIAKVEGKKDNFGNMSGYDRQWLLDTYAECLKATLNKRYVAQEPTTKSAHFVSGY